MSQDSENTDNKKNINSFTTWFKYIFNKHQFVFSILGSIIATVIINKYNYIVSIPKKFDDLENKIDQVITNISTEEKSAENNNYQNNFQIDFEKLSSKIDGFSDTIKLVQENYDKINSSFNRLTDDYKLIQGRLEKIDEEIDQISDDYREVNSDIKEIYKQLPPIRSISASSYSIDAINNLYSSVKNEDFKVTRVYNPKNIVGTDINTNTTYETEDLINKKIVMSYIDNGQTILFCGQYNDMGQWDGLCILNTYNNEEIISITDAMYENGKLLDYEQVLLDEKDLNNKRWFVSKRKNEGVYNSGETWQYKYISAFAKKSTIIPNEVSINDIISVDDFKANENLQLIGYYIGNTSNGRYNDSTGNAYLIKFTDDTDIAPGYVKYLYHGKIQDAKSDDNTGEAWEIAWGYDNDSYYYYNGIYINDNRTGLNGGDPPPIANNKLHEITDNIQLNVELKYFEYEDSNSPNLVK